MPTYRAVSIGDLDAAWQDRLADAYALLAAGRPASSIANGLYALEIRLKVLICRRLDLADLPTAAQFHDLQQLLVLAGLSGRIRDPASSSVLSNWNQVLTLAGLLNDRRYKPDASWSASQATVFLSWLEDPADGVLSWLSTQP